MKGNFGLSKRGQTIFEHYFDRKEDNMKVIIEIDGNGCIHILKKPKGVTLEIMRSTGSIETATRETKYYRYSHLTDIGETRRKVIL